VLGGSGLPKEAELWIMQIEDALRRAESGMRGDFPGLNRPAPGPLPGGAVTGRGRYRAGPLPGQPGRYQASPGRYPECDADGARAGEEVPDGGGLAGGLDVGGAVVGDGRALGDAVEGAGEGERDGLADDLAGLGDAVRGVRDGEGDWVWAGADVRPGSGDTAPAGVVAGRTSR
jgi:hypothetical protein